MYIFVHFWLLWVFLFWVIFFLLSLWFHCDTVYYIGFSLIKKKLQNISFPYLNVQILSNIFSSVCMGYFLQYFECLIQLARYNQPAGRLWWPPSWSKADTLKWDRRLIQNRSEFRETLIPFTCGETPLAHDGLANLEGTQVIFLPQHLIDWFFSILILIFYTCVIFRFENNISEFWTFLIFKREKDVTDAK